MVYTLYTKYMIYIYIYNLEICCVPVPLFILDNFSETHVPNLKKNLMSGDGIHIRVTYPF